MGTYNINGGKHFRSVVYKQVSLDDWLLDAHTKKKDTLVDLADEEGGSNDKIIDMYAIGFEDPYFAVSTQRLSLLHLLIYPFIFFALKFGGHATI